MADASAPSTRPFDFAAIGLSALCLVHCLALPVLAALLPALSVWAEAEWVHLVFVAVAIPLTGTALHRAHRRRRLPAPLVALALLGLSGLLLGALGWPTHELEVPLTVTGALLLAGVHVWNWSRHRHRDGEQCGQGEQRTPRTH
ncbi:MAG: MerC domain-containing protein [Pseudoxanthomonas sp.]